MELLEGKNIVGYSDSFSVTKCMHGFNPATGETLEGDFHIASKDEIEQALDLAQKAAPTYAALPPKRRAAFIRQIAEEIIALQDHLIERASAESGLPNGRFVGERGRTVGQLRLFADWIENGSWVEASIDFANPDRKPMPKVDIRKMLEAVGPVVVFTASNFPLAFSTAGGDTAAALAAGCPVIVKAHESHLGTNELVARAIRDAAKKTDMPEGVFASLVGEGHELGKKLVLDSRVQSVAFTGSLRGGKALYDLAAGRSNPIPVFSEMGSVNPMLLLPSALDRPDMPSVVANSVTMGEGQFCTNPGLLLAIDSDASKKFQLQLASEFEQKSGSTMLNAGIRSNYHTMVEKAADQAGVEITGKGKGDEQSKNSSVPYCATASGKAFLQNPQLHEEVFGPFTMTIVCADKRELDEVIGCLQGQLTCSIWGDEDELTTFAHSANLLKSKSGRIVFNNVPTGVEVCHSMHHGGPFPATTDARFTSVGMDAIKRFARPVCYQNWPASQLPDALKDGNPLGICRREDGEYISPK
jgi:2,5-dioxopentanoate dehydrogenase